MNARRFAVRGALAAALLATLLAALAGATPPAAARAADAAATPPAAAQAAPAAAPPAEDIHDIRGPKYVLPVWLLPAIVAGAALLGFAGYGLWRRRLRRRRPRVLSPFEVALQQLDAIRPLMQPATAREFSIQASDIVRRYIEQRFLVTATHRTTEEFLHDLLESPDPELSRHRALLAEFLESCDLVKFAGLSLTTQHMQSLHRGARAFVTETKEAHDPLPAT